MSPTPPSEDGKHRCYSVLQQSMKWKPDRGSLHLLWPALPQSQSSLVCLCAEENREAAAAAAAGEGITQKKEEV